MEILYAPWRADYAKSDDVSRQVTTNADDCVFCNALADKQDSKNLIIRRFEYCVVMLNKFPYNAGHLLILPYDHQAQLTGLQPAIRAQIMEVTTAATTILTNELKAQGINIGLNLGVAAGAGIPSHLHLHVLPRWTGDTNFLPVLSNVKHISFDLALLYNQLKPAFDCLFI